MVTSCRAQCGAHPVRWSHPVVSTCPLRAPASAPMSSRLSPCSLGRSRSSWHPACSCSCSDTQDVHHLAGEELAPSPRGSKRSLFSQPCLRSALLAIVLFVLIKNRETSRGQRAMAEMGQGPPNTHTHTHAHTHTHTVLICGLCQ